MIARFYHEDYAVFRTPSGDVDFYVEEARRAGGPVLELGCGTGRVLVPTAEAGVAITGVDLSPAMLVQARARLGERGLEAPLVEADMIDVDLGRTFALVTLPFRPIQHLLDPADHVRLFANVRRHLAPGGRLVLDVFHPDLKALAEPRPEQLAFERDHEGGKVRRYHAAVPRRSTQTLDVVMRWEVEDRHGRVEEFREEFALRWFWRYEVEHALARAGLAVEALHGDFDRSAFEDGSREMIFVAGAA